MRIVQFGLPYSPNLGDGIIAECFAHGVGEVAPEARVVSIDLSGRTGFGHTVVANRARALALLKRLPRPARHALVQIRLGRVLSWATPLWREALEGADLSVIGGGQLFSDADLNFPLKVARAADLAHAAGVPVAVHAAGVAGNWSRRGTALFARLFEAELRDVGLRDAPSVAAWRAQTGGRGPIPWLARDPGLLAADCYGPVEADERVGLCIAAADILSYHAEEGLASGTGIFADLARALMAEGHALRLFSNGAEEDDAALAAVAEALAAEVADGRVAVAPRPLRPATLAGTVASCRAVVAHRLHACIVAFAYGRPVIGLGWDRKVESFFASVGASRAFAPAGEEAGRVAARLSRAIAVGPDAAARETAEAKARDAIRRTLDTVTTPARRAPAA